jgi:hypothetical protein
MLRKRLTSSSSILKESFLLLVVFITSQQRTRETKETRKEVFNLRPNNDVRDKA